MIGVKELVNILKNMLRRYTSGQQIEIYIFAYTLRALPCVPQILHTDELVIPVEAVVLSLGVMVVQIFSQELQDDTESILHNSNLFYYTTLLYYIRLVTVVNNRPIIQQTQTVFVCG